MPLARHLAGPALLVATAALLAGCAQPGQLGHGSDAAPSDDGTTVEIVPVDPGPPPTTAVAVPGNGGWPARPITGATDPQGRIERPVEISTPGPADMLVREESLLPGESTGWIRHPGTMLTAVRGGTVTVVRAGRCEPQNFGTGEAFFLGDGEPSEVRNDGGVTVQLLRSGLLAPGAPEREPVRPAC